MLHVGVKIRLKNSVSMCGSNNAIQILSKASFNLLKLIRRTNNHYFFIHRSLDWHMNLHIISLQHWFTQIISYNILIKFNRVKLLSILNTDPNTVQSAPDKNGIIILIMWGKKLVNRRGVKNFSLQFHSSLVPHT